LAGGKQRSSETLTGLTLMGVRLYNPLSGRFLSLDPVQGGNDNAYGYPADPINQYDLDGRFGWGKFLDRVGTGLAIAGMFGCGACALVSAGISLGRGIYKVSRGDREGWMDIAGAATFGAGRAVTRFNNVRRASRMAKAPKGVRGRSRAHKRVRSRASKAHRRYNRRVVRRVHGVDRYYGYYSTGYSLYGEWRDHRGR
ncbi:hypothetical protein VR46_37560, partial [Streptomyces sp. NRRL S-444]